MAQKRLHKYVDITRAVRRKFLARSGCATYIDLFCGSGGAFIRDTDKLIDGSPLVAFKCARSGAVSFSEIHLADADEAKCKAAVTKIENAGGIAMPRARPMEEWWVEQLHEACARQDMAFFFKQWGGKRKKRTGRLFKDRTWDDYPRAAASAW